MTDHNPWLEDFEHTVRHELADGGVSALAAALANTATKAQDGDMQRALSCLAAFLGSVQRDRRDQLAAWERDVHSDRLGEVGDLPDGPP